MNAAAPIPLVTEANHGIGRATVHQLADPGHVVLLRARRPKDAESAAEPAQPARRPRTAPVRLLGEDGAIPEQVAAELSVSRSTLYRELRKHRESTSREG
ncbi:hypothetical protein ACFYNZ_17650 [Streptomyces kebangsaanensis]|uniref:HTH domain-containing protein n=1 Tax=Streptomyces kebangsaanensis TaxID=864058 RepID=A0ABW6KU35_9ACTN